MLALAASLLFISQVSAGVLGEAGHLARRGNSIERAARRYVDSVIVEPVQRRSATTGVNATEWDAQTTTACMTTLTAMNGMANNPAGMAVCYNLPFLDNSTGVFEADLRLYMIAPPTGSFASISSANVQVGLSYAGATVSTVNASSLKRREESSAVSLISWPRDVKSIQKRNAPVLIQSYAFVGQINKDLMATTLTTDVMQKAVIPLVTLTGTDSTGASVNTSLIQDEANFVSGVFAKSVTITKSAASAPIQTLVIPSGTTFVLPGTSILIFPIGGVITGLWTVLFISTIAYGTMGRMQFREQFRRRTTSAAQSKLSTI